MKLLNLKNGLFVTFGCILVGIITLYIFDPLRYTKSCDAVETVSQYEKGLVSRNRHVLETIIADDVHLTTPMENSYLSKSEFLNRVLRDEFLVSAASFSYESHEIEATRATVKMLENIRIDLPDDHTAAEHEAFYVYDLRYENDRWKIYGITQTP